MSHARTIWRDLCEAAVKGAAHDLRGLVAKAEHAPFPPDLGYAACRYAHALKDCARAWSQLPDAAARAPFTEPLLSLAKCVWDRLQPPGAPARTDVDG